MKILVVDPFGGISGDMLMAGLIHLGCPAPLVEDSLDALGLGRCGLRVEGDSVGGVPCLKAGFDTAAAGVGRSHREIQEVVLVRLAEGPRRIAARIFDALARAEAEIHGVAVDDVHFHEVGALDSIFDIAGIAVAVDHLKVQKVYTRPVPLGYGRVQSAHGMLGVPAPASVKLLEGFPVSFEGPNSELATPTGAAVIAALATRGGPPPGLRIVRTGYGCGTRRFEEWPNVCRLFLCEAEGPGRRERACKLEADIDDMTPEDASFALERIMDAGALDVSLSPRIMKRSRPGFTVQAICLEDALEGVLDAFVRHTATIGVRYHEVDRFLLPRRLRRVATAHGEVAVKEVRLPDGSVRAKPEYSDLERISLERGIAVAELRAEVERALHKPGGGEDGW
jgi:uncharacterized protein (TIGR00299 family) protein